jgi:hypothetical protein
MPATFLTDIAGVGLLGASIAPATVASATTTNGSAVDCIDCDDTVAGFFVTGNCGDATLELDCKLQEAIEDPASLGNPLSSDWSDFDPDAELAQLAGATAADSSCRVVTGRRSKRFVRCVAITAGAGTLSVPIAGFVMGRKKISGTGNGAKLD